MPALWAGPRRPMWSRWRPSCAAPSSTTPLWARLPQRGRRNQAMRALLHQPDAGRLPPLRRLLHHRRPHGRGHLGSGRQAAAHRDRRHRQPGPVLPYVASPPEVHARADQPDRVDASARAPLVSRHLGTDPEAQGKGVGSALMRPGPRALRRRGLPATSSRPRSATCPSTPATASRSSRRCRSPAAGPSIWTMWREPAERDDIGPARDSRAARRGQPTAPGGVCSGRVDALGHGEGR
jgi:GNAT superfamily N-acetyltransferase